MATVPTPGLYGDSEAPQAALVAYGGCPSQDPLLVGTTRTLHPLHGTGQMRLGGRPRDWSRPRRPLGLGELLHGGDLLIGRDGEKTDPDEQGQAQERQDGPRAEHRRFR